MTLPPDPGSVRKTIKRVNLQMKIWLQSLNQNMTFPFSEQNGCKWYDDKSVTVPVIWTDWYEK